jgi:hypothetical protein
VSSVRHGSISALAVTWLAGGGTFLALAFTVRPIHASRGIFWAAVGVAAVALLVGCAVVIRGMVGWGSGAAERRRRRLLASDCWRIYEALAAFVAERDLARPRAVRRPPSASRVEEWRSETVTRYRDELLVWAIGAFDAAVACGAAAASARALVQTPAANQLGMVRDLFRDAAQILERS